MESSTIFTNFTNSTEAGHMGAFKLPFNDAWVVTSTCVLAILFVFGVTANSLTIVVIHSSPLLKNRYYSFLLSICVSDTISAFVSILFLYRRTWGFDYFHLPVFFCRLYWGLDLWTSFSTALHILSFALLRLIGVRWPTKFRKITSRHMKIWIGSVWLITFLTGFIPHFLFNTVNHIDRHENSARSHFASCSLSPYWISTWQVYVQFAYATFIYLPALSIIGMSIAIALLLKKHRFPPGSRLQAVTPTPSRSPLPSKKASLNESNNNSSVDPKPPTIHVTASKANNRHETAADRRWRKDKQAIFQLFLVVGSFLLGYIPLTAFHFYTVFAVHTNNEEVNAFDWKFAMVQYFLLRFSECLNPVFYNVASQKMREETVKKLKESFRFLLKSKENHPVPKPSAGTSSGI